MFLYVIKCGRCVKIGITNNVEKRLQTLQTGNAENMEVVRLVKVPDNSASKIEKSMHEKFASYRCKGEWFSGEILKDIYKMSDNEIIGSHSPGTDLEDEHKDLSANRRKKSRKDIRCKVTADPTMRGIADVLESILLDYLANESF